MEPLKSKQVHNEPTEAYFFLIKHITNLIKIESHVRLRTKGVRSGVDETIGHINKKIGHANESIQYE